MLFVEASDSWKATGENPRGSVKKLSPEEIVKGADTVLRRSVRAPVGFSEGKPEAAKPRGRSPQRFIPKGLPGIQGTRGNIYSTLPQVISTVAQTTKMLRFTGK